MTPGSSIARISTKLGVGNAWDPREKRAQNTAPAHAQRDAPQGEERVELVLPRLRWISEPRYIGELSLISEL